MTDLEKIRARNAKVEADKAWEISWTRRLAITIMTYIVVLIYLMALGMQNAYFHAIVPAGGYFISTLTLPMFKKIWLKQFYRPHEVSE